MNEKSEMEILYEQYLEDDKRTFEKDGMVFYKLLKKDKLKLRGGMILITVPREAVKSINDCYYDEAGNRVIIEAPIHMSFGRNGIPKWYFDTVTLPVKDIADVSEIGDYIGRDCSAKE